MPVTHGVHHSTEWTPIDEILPVRKEVTTFRFLAYFAFVEWTMVGLTV
jgi:hypothetical protein